MLGDVDLDLLDEQGTNGTILPLNDPIRDAHDRVIQRADTDNRWKLQH